VLDGADVNQSEKDYDWLGPGAYFWESDPLRALEWAQWKKQRGEYENPSVIGAVVDLRNCLDLVSREDVELVKNAYDAFVKIRRHSGLELPTNRNPDGTEKDDLLLRFLDCAVLRHLHEMVDETPDTEPFDTVRGMFVEGGKAFPGSGIHRRSHVQIAVRNPACIKGLFFPRNWSRA